MPLNVGSFSRFKNTETIIFRDEEVHGKWVPPTVLAEGLPEGQFKRIIVPASREGRPDRIANDEYGSTELDWVLIVFNNARESLNWPRAGEVISIPNIDAISSDLP